MTLVDHRTGELVETLNETEARRLTDRIRLLAETVAEQLDKMAKLIDEARVGSAWLALGYSSWTAYVSEEFAGVLPRLDREPRREFVRELAAQGMSTRAIAPVVGTDHTTVVRDLKTGGADAPPVPSEMHEQKNLRDLTPEDFVGPLTPQGEEETSAKGNSFGASDARNPDIKVEDAPRPAVTGLDGKTYTRPPAPKPIDYVALADAAVAEFPDLTYYRDEVIDLEHCWRLAEKLREYRSRGELEDRLATLRRSIDLDRSKRDGTYVPTPSPEVSDSKTCPTCGQEVSI